MDIENKFVNENKDRKENCVVGFCGGLGNCLQSIPFIIECKKRYKKVYARYGGQDFTKELAESTLIIMGHLFDDVFHPSEKISEEYDIFTSPIENPIRDRFESWDESESERWFTAHGFEKPDKYEFDVKYAKIEQKSKVIFCAGSKRIWRSKRYPYYPHLSEYFDDVAIVGLPGEGEEIKEFPDHVKDYRGNLDILEIGGLIKNADIFISNDSGLGHYANALGARTYLIFGASDSVKNMPPKRCNLYKISLGLPCQGGRGCQFTPEKKFSTGKGCASLSCLQDLTPNYVVNFINNSFLPFAETGYGTGKLNRDIEK